MILTDVYTYIMGQAWEEGTGAIMQKIYLVRHGETALNQQFRYQGRQDIPLNETGRRQAMLIAARLNNEEIEAIYSSPLLRTRETALLIAARHGMTPYFENGLAEIDFGDWEGTAYTELSKEQRLNAERWFINPESVHIPGGEHFLSFKNRVLDCYAGILRHNGGNLLIVTHAGVIRVIVAAILAIPAANLARLSLAPSSLTILMYDDWGNGYLELFNETCHLR